jgi:hypothetical protein
MAVGEGPSRGTSNAFINACGYLTASTYFANYESLEDRYLRSLMFVLSLIATLAGAPLRAAEAAHDLATSVADLGDGDTLEMPDGGVGDDSGATIRSEVSRAPLESAGAHSLPAACLVATWRSSVPVERKADRIDVIASGVARRLARLQCFLC